MANSIDWGTLALGAVVGVGCRKQIKACGRIAAVTAANLAGVAATTAASLAGAATQDQSTQAQQSTGKNGKNG